MQGIFLLKKNIKKNFGAERIGRVRIRQKMVIARGENEDLKMLELPFMDCGCGCGW
jgi:hypothetical protein